MKSIAVLRASDVGYIRTGLRDLIVHANLTFESSARILDPEFADEILERVMKKKLQDPCDAAAAAPLLEDARIAIGKIRDIHPPCHMIIVGPRHNIYYTLKEQLNDLEPIRLDLENEQQLLKSAV